MTEQLKNLDCSNNKLVNKLLGANQHNKIIVRYVITSYRLFINKQQRKKRKL